jgi:hypothetical protein
MPCFNLFLNLFKVCSQIKVHSNSIIIIIINNIITYSFHFYLNLNQFLLNYFLFINTTIIIIIISWKIKIMFSDPEFLVIDIIIIISISLKNLLLKYH